VSGGRSIVIKVAETSFSTRHFPHRFGQSIVRQPTESHHRIPSPIAFLTVYTLLKIIDGLIIAHDFVTCNHRALRQQSVRS
jgi:hypothetical protein